MTVILNPYLNFRGNARQAMEFYQSVFGGDLVAQTFADFNAPVGDGEQDLIMHSQLTAPGVTLMGSDTPTHMDWAAGINTFSLSLSGGGDDDDAVLRGYSEKLAADGTVTQPLEVAPWGDAFGMLVDKFGITWLVNIAGAAA